MLKEVRLENFKSHKSTNIKLDNLTVLCGANGVGKSSIVQILLLIREAIIKDRSFQILDLKSNPVKIGTANDAIYEFGEYDGFCVQILFSDNTFCKLWYEASTEEEKSKSFITLEQSKSLIAKGTESVDILDGVSLVSTHSLFSKYFQYISAARKGPQQSYPKDDKIVDVYRQISVNEGEAEFFAHFLDRYRNYDVIPEMCLPLNSNLYNDLHTQVGLWEKYIFDGANTDIQDVGKLGYVLKYSFDVEMAAKKRTSDYDAKNVGFGLTYVLPILIAILSSKKDSIVVVENPEAHLHPSGISRLTEFICRAAQAGIQIILETHSDHILNGVLVQSKAFEDSNSETGISRENISIYQFDRDNTNHSTLAIKVIIEEEGRIYDKPAGFFDQIANDLRELM